MFRTAYLLRSGFQLLPALVMGAVLVALPSSAATSAAGWVATGRGFLTQSNLVAANDAFAQALKLDPALAEANVLHSATRLLLVPSLPAVSNLLTRLGVPAQGRDVYNWSAAFPMDDRGRLAPPGSVAVSEISDVLRGTVLPELAAAEAELAKVTSPTFLLHLTADETRLSEVAIDQGDVLVARAMLNALEFWFYTLHSWDLQVPIRVMSTLEDVPGHQVDDLLAAYPHLFEFANAADRLAGQAALVECANAYLQGIPIILGRLPSQSRLFNLDQSKRSARRERSVRQLLQDLRDSLAQPVTLSLSPAFRVNMDRWFNGTWSLRSFAPQFIGTKPVAGTWPDATFSGILLGLSPGELERAMEGVFGSVFRLTSPRWVEGTGMRFDIVGVPGKSYTVWTVEQLAAGPLPWLNIATVYSADGRIPVVDTGALQDPHRFYVVDRALQPANDAFRNRAVIQGESLLVYGSNAGATEEPGEPPHEKFGPVQNWQSVWWSWTAPRSGRVVIDPCWGNYPAFELYTGSSLPSLKQIARSGTPPSYSCAIEFQAQAGVAYAIAAGIPFGDGAELRFRLFYPTGSPNTSPATGGLITKLGALVEGTDARYLVDVNNPSDDGLWWRWKAPADGRYRVARQPQDDGHAYSIYDQDENGDPSGILADGSASTVFDALAGQEYFVHSRQLNAGDHAAFRLGSVDVPSNDDPPGAIALTGSEASVVASNLGATLGPEEPQPEPWEDIGSTVWWKWTAPKSGSLSVGTFASDFDLSLAFFQRQGDEWSQLPTGGDFGGTAYQFVNAGDTLYLRVGGWGGAAGQVVLYLQFYPF
jgi:hypothetical protein